MSPAMSAPAILVFTPDGERLPGGLEAWLSSQRAPRLSVPTGDELMAIALRTRPRMVVFDARTKAQEVLIACSRLKTDSYTGIVPALILTADGTEAVTAAFYAGAD